MRKEAQPAMHELTDQRCKDLYLAVTGDLRTDDDPYWPAIIEVIRNVVAAVDLDEATGTLRAWGWANPHEATWRIRELARGPVDSTPPMTGAWTVRHDMYGWVDGIEQGGFTMLHLVPGSVRNEHMAEYVVGMLNRGLEAEA